MGGGVALGSSPGPTGDGRTTPEGEGVSIEVGNSSETSRDGGSSIDKDGIEK